jgi:exopolysaccharide biosynthesis predicted pyruvyltransferase EpsI
MSRVMICDRLHAAILGYLSQVPFVYLDQVSNKVTNVLNVSFSSTPEFPDDNHDCMDGTKHMFKKASSIEEAIPMALQMIEDYDL